MNLRPGEAIEVIEDHRGNRLAEFNQLGWGLVKHAAFVIGTNDENAHIPGPGGLNGFPIEIVDEIPVQIDVIKGVRLDGTMDLHGRSVGGKTDELDAPFGLQLQ